jgi:hypothetical protein
MKNEKAHQRRALFAMEAIAVCATSCRKEWKGKTPPTMEEVDEAIRRLSYCVGTLKDYRSIRIQMEKEKEEEE